MSSKSGFSLLAANAAERMRRRSPFALVVCLIGWLLLEYPAAAQMPGGPYRIEIDPDRPLHIATRDHQGKPALYLTMQFMVVRAADGSPASDVGKNEIVVEEDGRRITNLEIFQPRGLDPVTVIMALDISGSMEGSGKIATARRAAGAFLDALQEPTDCGLILFDHQLRTVEPPAAGIRSLSAHKERLRDGIRRAEPAGGTAYLDAAARAIELLRTAPGRKAVLVMTDGIDLNSRHTTEEVIRLAQAARVPLYTLGVGDPGTREPVSTILVLDRSGSMGERAGSESKVTKMEALRRAAGQYIQMLRPGALTTLLPFSDRVETPEPFTSDKTALVRRINRLEEDGQTAVYDAAHAAIETLAAARQPGKRAIIVLTDGIDNASRHRPEEVIARALETGTVVHTLGFGRPGEFDEGMLRRLAQRTGGEFHHARDEPSLFQAFEALAIQLHDEGIDEPTLRRLADATGGKYFPARDLAKLHLIYQEVAEELQTTWTVTFPSQRPRHDGTTRGLSISVVRNGQLLSEVMNLGYTVHGVVVPHMDPGVYLVLLAVLGGLLALPAGLRRLFASGGGHGR